MTTTFDISAVKKLPARFKDGSRTYNTFEANISDEGIEVYPSGNFPGISDDDGMIVAIFRDMDEVESALDDKMICNHYEVRPSKYFDYGQPKEYETFKTGHVSMKEFYDEFGNDAGVLSELFKGAKNYTYLEA